MFRVEMYVDGEWRGLDEFESGIQALALAHDFAKTGNAVRVTLWGETWI